MAAITLEDVNKNLAEQNSTLKKTDKNIAAMSGSLSSLIQIFKGKKLRGREEAIEGGAKRSGGLSSGDAASAGLFGGIGAALAGLAGMITPLIAGLAGVLLASFDETMNDISRTFAAAFLGVGDKVKSIMKGFAGLFSIDGRIGKLLKFEDLYIYFDDARKGLIALFAGPDTLIGRISSFFKSTFGEESMIGKAFAKIKSALTFTEDSGIVKLMNGLGGVLKKIFLPVGLIFTAYDTVAGVIEGYEKEGIIGGLVGGVTGFFKSIIGAPLNLLRDASAWILKKLGMEETAKWLQKNFDFEKLFDDIGEGLIKFIKSPIDTIKGWLTSIFGKAEDRNADGSVNETADSFDEFSGVPQFKKGSGGMRNFGSGTLAMLHGREEVVPEDSEKGKVLSALEKYKKAGFDVNVTKAGEILLNRELADGTSETISSTGIRTLSGIDGVKKYNMETGELISHQKTLAENFTQTMKPNKGIEYGYEMGLLGKVTATVKEGQDIKNAQMSMARQPQPIVIQDNSSRSSGTTNTAMPVQSVPHDFDDPFVRGLRA